MNSIQVNTNKIKYNPVNGMDMILTLSNTAPVSEDGTLVVLSQPDLSSREVKYILCVSIGGKFYELRVSLEHYTGASISWSPSTSTINSIYLQSDISHYYNINTTSEQYNVTQDYYNNIYNGIMQQINTSSYNPNNVSATNFRSIKSNQSTLNKCNLTGYSDLSFFLKYYPGNSNANFDEEPNILFVLRYSNEYPYNLNFIAYNYVDVKGQNTQSFKKLSLATRTGILRTNEKVYEWDSFDLRLTPGRNSAGKNNTSIVYNVVDQVITGSKNTNPSKNLYGEGNVYNFNYDRGTWDNYYNRILPEEPGEAFGVSMAGSRDHSVIVIGANVDNLSSDLFSVHDYGYACVYRRQSPEGMYVKEQEFRSRLATDVYDCFAGSVCMSGDGNVLVIGTKLTSRVYYDYLEDLDTFYYYNTIQYFNVYRYNPDGEDGAKWEFKLMYTCPYSPNYTSVSGIAHINFSLNFPSSISMNYDGTKIVASGYRSLIPSILQTSELEYLRTKEDQFALVFHYDGNTSLQEVQKLTTPVQPDDDGPWPRTDTPVVMPEGITGGPSIRASFANYGFCCKLSENEEFLMVSEITGNNSSGLIGIPRFDIRPNVYIYRLNGSEYQLYRKIKAGKRREGATSYGEEVSIDSGFTSDFTYILGNYFGYQLEISSDNNTFFITDTSVYTLRAPYDDPEAEYDVGGLFIFNDDGEEYTINSSFLGELENDQFGFAMAKAYQKDYIAVTSTGGNRGTGYFKVFKKYS